MYRLLFILLSFLWAAFPARSTVGLPSFRIQNYTVDDYKASCQNWDLAVSYNGLLYVANNSGLLIYDGNTWRVYPLPDQSPLTQVTFFNDTVYTQGPTSKGYWLSDAYGRQTYHPLEAFPPGVGFGETSGGDLLPSSVAGRHPTVFAQAGPLCFIGTARDGLYVANRAGEFLAHFSTQNFLPDNIVRALCVQDVNLVWAAFDNGLSQIETDPSVLLVGKRAEIGKLQAARLQNDTLYIRTNTGYFKRPLTDGRQIGAGSAGKHSSLPAGISGANGKPNKPNGQLTGSSTGPSTGSSTSRLTDSLTGEPPGEQSYRQTHEGAKGRINYPETAMLLQTVAWEETSAWEETDLWQHANARQDTNTPAGRSEKRNATQQINPAADTNLTPDTNLAANTDLAANTNNPALNKNAGMITPPRRTTNAEKRMNARRIINADAFSNEPDSLLSVASLFRDPASLETFAKADGVYPAHDNLYWLTAGNEAGLFHLEQGEGILKCRILFDNYNLNLVTSGKRIFSLNDSLDLVSTMQGALLINTRRLIAGSLGGLTMPRFRQISYTDAEGLHPLRPDTSKIVLPHSFQELTVYVGTTVFTPHHQISYKLEGVSTEWSPWQKSGKISFLQLPEGKYELRVRKYVVKGPYPEISLSIEVRPPWYNTVWAYLVYILLIWLIGQTALRGHLRNLRREEQRRQEAERQAEAQKLHQMKSDMLEAELQNKNNELLLQTSALVKRNQAIQSFLDELARQKETLGDRYPNKLYNKIRSLMEEALNDQADWLQFESYFNGAHRNFMDRLQEQYADLTTGDLRICCLLRMNLSTKEIASLLNISVRAVELRRYRLRKRLGLEGETNLVEFLMKF